MKKIDAAESNSLVIESPVKLDELFPEYSGINYDFQAEERKDQLINEVREAYLGEGLAIYVGAGVSMSAGLPSWTELINSLTIAMMSQRVSSAVKTLENLTDEEKGEALAAMLDAVKTQKSPTKPILMMARALKDQFEGELPQKVAAHLYSSLLSSGSNFFLNLLQLFSGKKFENISSKELDLPKSDLINALVSLIRPQREVAGVQAIINYNYDDILEESLRANSVPCLTILSGKQKMHRGKIPSYHVHGVLPILKYMNIKQKMKK